jgi:thiamine biosynthesis lipoprotein
MLHRYRFRAMGSPCTLHLHGETRTGTDRLARDCEAEVRRLEAKYSRYADDSVASRINRSAGEEAGLVVDEETAGLLDYAATCFAQSEGLFDVTSGILRRVWDLKSGRVPAREEIGALLPRIGWQRLRWERPRIVLPVPGMELDFGGYVKEYAADRVASLCRQRGTWHGLVDLGGDLAVVGPHPDGSPWRVGIRDPRRRDAALLCVDVFGGGVATSGDYERCMVVDGVRYGHVLDPRSGWPVDGLVSVSVLASHCLIAGTASTVAMLKGRAEAPRWLEALDLPHVRLDRDGTLALCLAPTRRAA